MLAQHRGQLMFQAVQADSPERDDYVVVRALDDQPGPRFGEAHQGPPHPKPVGGRPVVVDDHVAQHRQAADAVVRHGKDERFPRKARAFQVGPGGAVAQRDGAAIDMADPLD